ncbi:N-formylglutamate amidohydrolase [Bosea sp. (in: a-proteobacteria)]|uniref:N-formylglutamate amidohydrolase n=1 Tax=Bosea sp. (in: a-proteobacteria) TaxID=1871050 RepID=UPI0026311BA7|nr:N-formylglutamate amidohydrolase [Bosea sp. (in: a-proteobacteria)]MCO5091382.1 N-formylglutamate amidohydrolase [Bosea sp. (in: a-proteobacteria)]
MNPPCAPLPPAPDDVVAEIERPFSLYQPALQLVPVVVDVPHAGRRYPSGFVAGARLPLRGLRRSEDAYVDRLFAHSVALGAPLLVAQFPRAYLDVNREPYELDPRMFEGRVPPFANTRSMRVAGGLGTIPRIVGDGQEIYPGRIPIQEGLSRIDGLYRPYHAALRGLVQRTQGLFGTCILVDAHSMPSAGLDRDGPAKSDIILGDRFGTSAAAYVCDIAEQAFARLGLSVTRNRPYAGGFITEHYGAPAAGVHALQIEVNRALYMNEATLEPHGGFEAIERAMAKAMADCFARWSGWLDEGREAAE